MKRALPVVLIVLCVMIAIALSSAYTEIKIQEIEVGATESAMLQSAMDLCATQAAGNDGQFSMESTNESVSITCNIVTVSIPPSE